MKFNLGLTLLLLALLTFLFSAMAWAAPPPTLSGSVSLGGAISQLPGTHPFNEQASCPVALAAFRVDHLIGPLCWTGEVRHLFTSDTRSVLYGRSKFVTGLEVPVAPTVTVFANYENNYRRGEDGQWCWAGVRFGFRT